MRENTEPMPRVAVLISGQVRSETDELQAISRACEGVNADVFISVWRKRGTKGFGGGQGPQQLGRVFGRKLALIMPRHWVGSNMRKVFPNEGHIFPTLDALSEQEILDIFPKAHVKIVEEREDLVIPYMDSNSLRMLFMIDKANRLKQAKEEKLGLKYDVVIRHRPDVRINYANAIAKIQATGKTIFPMGDKSRINQLHDIYWVANSEDDDTLTGLYYRAEETRAEGWWGIHNELRKWVVAHEIDFEMYNCMISGIQETSFRNADLQKTVAANFVEAIRECQLDVEQAGGEVFCQIFTPVFEAAQELGTSATLPVRFDFSEVNEAKIRPRFKLFLLQAQGWLLVMNPQLSVSDRLSAFILTLSIDYLTRHERTAEWCVGAVPEIFDQRGSALEIANYFSHDVLQNITTSAAATELFDWIKQLSNEEPEILKKNIRSVVRGIYNAKRNNGWLSEGLKLEDNTSALIGFVEKMLETGAYMRGTVSFVADLCRKDGAHDRMLNILEKASEIDASAFSFGVLGRHYYIANKPLEAEQALSKALNLPNCPPWVGVTMSKLKEA